MERIDCYRRFKVRSVLFPLSPSPSDRSISDALSKARSPQAFSPSPTSSSSTPAARPSSDFFLHLPILPHRPFLPVFLYLHLPLLGLLISLISQHPTASIPTFARPPPDSACSTVFLQNSFDKSSNLPFLPHPFLQTTSSDKPLSRTSASSVATSDLSPNLSYSPACPQRIRLERSTKHSSPCNQRPSIQRNGRGAFVKSRSNVQDPSYRSSHDSNDSQETVKVFESSPWRIWRRRSI